MKLLGRKTTGDRFPIAADAEGAVDRRRFLIAITAAAAMTAVGEWAAMAVAAVRRRPLVARLPAGAELAIGEARAVLSPDGREALVVRLGENEVVAFDRRCPHLGCPVVWAAARGRFECPCHRAAFDARNGQVLFGPPREGLEPAHIVAAEADSLGEGS